jgi:hypothetical protein
LKIKGDNSEKDLGEGGNQQKKEKVHFFHHHCFKIERKK